MINVYLVRHATFKNPDNIIAGRLMFPLSEQGREEAERLNKYFADKDISKIYASTVQRCVETAEMISNKKIDIEYDDRLCETFSAYKSRFGELLGGESPQEVQKRMTDFFDNNNWVDGKNYIICSHGDPLYYLYLYISKISLADDAKNNHAVPKFTSYQEKASVRPIVYEKGKWKVEKIITQDYLKTRY